MSAVDIFSIANDILVGLAASITAMAALFGLRSWRTELKGKTEFETARQLMKATYRVRDTLVSSRAPFIDNSEFPLEYQRADNATLEQDVSAHNYMFKNRWKPVSSSLIDLDTDLLEAEALWGENIRNSVDRLKQCAREVVIAMEAIVADKAERGQNFIADPTFAQDMRDKAFASRSDNQNRMNIRITESIGDIESIVRPHLQRN